MAGFLKKRGKEGDGNGRRAAAVTEGRAARYLANYARLIQYFPIGTRIAYAAREYGEHRHDSVVVAYAINGRLLYAMDEIRVDIAGRQPAITIRAGGREEKVGAIDEFQVLIPYNPRDEGRLDYDSRVELGPRGMFGQGSVITLLSPTRDGVYAEVEANAYRVREMSDGFYVGHRLVLLDPIPASIKLSDKRKFLRVHTRLPVRVNIESTGATVECLLSDLSEDSMRLIPVGEKVPLAIDDIMQLSLNLEPEVPGKRFSLRGRLYRQDDAELVVHLDAIYRQGSFQPLAIIDALEIKAAVLQHPVTRGHHG